jgi:hypothetical protein
MGIFLKYGACHQVQPQELFSGNLLFLVVYHHHNTDVDVVPRSDLLLQPVESRPRGNICVETKDIWERSR